MLYVESTRLNYPYNKTINYSTYLDQATVDRGAIIVTGLYRKILSDGGFSLVNYILDIKYTPQVIYNWIFEFHGVDTQYPYGVYNHKEDTLTVATTINIFDYEEEIFKYYMQYIDFVFIGDYTELKDRTWIFVLTGSILIIVIIIVKREMIRGIIQR